MSRNRQYDDYGNEWGLDDEEIKERKRNKKKRRRGNDKRKWFDDMSSNAEPDYGYSDNNDFTFE